MVLDTGRVNLVYDGLNLSPGETLELLHRLAKEQGIKADSYSLGGVVEDLERKFARFLGKEAAIFMPTGTLANHIALRSLSKDGNRIVVQGNSHIYQDSGDCMQQLSGINLVPLSAADREDDPGFSLDQLKQLHSESLGGKVKTGIGAISIESPVRRMNGKTFPEDELRQIISFAKDNQIPLHLDGARLLIEAACKGISSEALAKEFDTVYVSLYKYLNAPFGAILAGRREMIEGLYHQRRMFGGGLNQVWISAFLALSSLENFLTDYRRVISLTNELLEVINALGTLTLETIPQGTNVYRLILPEQSDPEAFRRHLKERQVLLPPPEATSPGFVIKTNESLLSADLEALVSLFEEALQMSLCR